MGDSRKSKVLERLMQIGRYPSTEFAELSIFMGEELNLRHFDRSCSPIWLVLPQGLHLDSTE